MSEPSKRYHPRDMARLLWPIISQHRNLLTLVALTVPFGVIGQTLKPLLLQQTIDGSLARGDLEGLLRDCALFAGVVLGAFVFKSLGVYGLQMIGIRSLAGLRHTLFCHVLNQGQAFFDTRTTGALMTRTTSDVDAIGESLTRGVIGLISDALLIVGTLGMMIWLNPMLTLMDPCCGCQGGGSDFRLCEWGSARIRDHSRHLFRFDSVHCRDWQPLQPFCWWMGWVRRWDISVSRCRR